LRVNIVTPKHLDRDLLKFLAGRFFLAVLKSPGFVAGKAW
jgi:hypothetical protein